MHSTRPLTRRTTLAPSATTPSPGLRPRSPSGRGSNKLEFTLPSPPSPLPQRGEGRVFPFLIAALPQGRCERIEGALEHVPSRTRGDFRGVAGNPHQVLIQQWLPPSSARLEKSQEEGNKKTRLTLPSPFGRSARVEGLKPMRNTSPFNVGFQDYQKLSSGLSW